MLDLVCEPACKGCSVALGAGDLCEECEAGLDGPLRRLDTAGTLFTGAWSLGPYLGPLGSLVRQAKFAPDESTALLLAQRLGAALVRSPLPAFEAVVPVPTTPWRLMWRGFHLPELLAERAATAVRAPVVAGLRRRWTGAQGALRRRDRSAAAAGLFVARAALTGRVLLVDDVATTGSTAQAAACELIAAGADSVALLVLASAGSLPRVGIS